MSDNTRNRRAPTALLAVLLVAVTMAITLWVSDGGDPTAAQPGPTSDLGDDVDVDWIADDELDDSWFEDDAGGSTTWSGRWADTTWTDPGGSWGDTVWDDSTWDETTWDDSWPGDDAPPTDGPAVVTLDAPATYTCGSGPYYDTPAVITLRWTSVDAVSVTVAIDDPNGAFMTDLAPIGELEVPAPCTPESRTYYVVAVGADGSTHIRSHTIQGI